MLKSTTQNEQSTNAFLRLLSLSIYGIYGCIWAEGQLFSSCFIDIVACTCILFKLCNSCEYISWYERSI